MTKREIQSELSKIYKEMESWREINKKFDHAIPKDEVSRRELFLIGREVLYKLEAAKKSKDKLAERQHASTYYLLKATMELY